MSSCTYCKGSVDKPVILVKVFGLNGQSKEFCSPDVFHGSCELLVIVFVRCVYSLGEEGYDQSQIWPGPLRTE
eukprot:scaffold4614_cov104-Skeletonema_dohrnii-CCMP3373.AAC.1